MRARAAIAIAFAVAASPPALAQEGSPITIIVGYSTGGAYDLTARLWSRHLGRFLPGKPNIVVQNMPGAGSMAATNHLYNLAPRDGTTLAVINGATVFEPLFANPAAKYNPTKFNWIGGRTPETALCAVWHTAKAKTFADTLKYETTVGGVGPGSRTNNHPLLLDATLGSKLRVVSGYPGGAEITIAMERGEVDGFCGWAWGAIKIRALDWVKEGRMRLLIQTGLAKIPELPDVPFALDLARTQEDRALMEALMTDTQLAWPLVAPPDMPETKVAQLRAAFDAMMKDPELIKDAAKMQLELDPVGGAAMQQTVARLFGLPPAIVARAKSIIK